MENLENYRKCVSELSVYELIQSEQLDDIQSVGLVLKHKKSGARIAIIANDDDNKVFNIGFRTPPANSTGVAHIIEHSVLCGSANFPVKDPFIELVKGSLNTFLNAMTYPDKTMYPIASCNDQDFQNLMHVYLDSVLYPNIYKHREIFEQEGWHYELEDAEGELKYNGVVYNEMKGVYSSPNSLITRYIQQALFPDTCYGVNSGGNPEKITDLSYEEFLAFHKKYYHPSNSYIYFYGNMDIVEKLKWLDEEYLSKFDVQHVDSEILEQPDFSEVHLVEKLYPVTEQEGTKDKTFLSYNFGIGPSTDQELCLAFYVLEKVLLSAPGAPLKQAILDANIGSDVDSSFEYEFKKTMLSIIVKNSEMSKLDDFVHVIKRTLKEIIKTGLDQKSIQAAIASEEFKFREADFGRTPKGLMYGIQMMSTWLYDDREVFTTFYENKTLDSLKEKIGTGFYEDLIQRYFIDNQNAAMVILKPEVGLSKKREEALKKKLADFKKNLSQKEIEDIIRATKHLREYQEVNSTPEELKCIPMLSREDITKKAMPIKNDEHDFNGIKMVHHDYFTNGIAYVKFIFEVNKCPNRLLPYLGILNSLLGYIDTKKHTFLDLANDINMVTGGITNSIYAYGMKGSSRKYRPVFSVSTKVLYERISEGFALIQEIISESKLDDTKRIEEVLQEIKSRNQAQFLSGGQNTAMDRAFSYFSPEANFEQKVKGITYLDFICELLSSFQEKKDEIVANLKEAMKYIFNQSNLIMSITCDEEGFKLVWQQLSKVIDCLSKETIPVLHEEDELVRRNEGLKTSGQVQYVATVANLFDAGFKYHGSLKVLRTIMGYDYLWLNIRMKGGAYGCMCNFSGVDGNMYFVSYRDPNLKATKEVYRNAADYVRNFSADEREMTKYVLGTISTVDAPLNAQAKGNRSFTSYMSNTSYEAIQKDRTELLQTSVEDIRNLADIVDALGNSEYFCTVGNEDRIEENRELFIETRSLF